MANQLIVGETTIHVGDTIRVHYKLIEKEKVTGKAKREVKVELRERIQVFEGIVINIRGSGENKTFTVRRISTGKIGVERIFPSISPWIKKVEVKQRGKVRRAKLYYLRDTIGREVGKMEERVEKQPTKKKKTKKQSK